LVKAFQIIDLEGFFTGVAGYWGFIGVLLCRGGCNVVGQRGGQSLHERALRNQAWGSYYAVGWRHNTRWCHPLRA
jgi:hypothetical protein